MSNSYHHDIKQSEMMSSSQNSVKHLKNVKQSENLRWLSQMVGWSGTDDTHRQWPNGGDTRPSTSQKHDEDCLHKTKFCFLFFFFLLSTRPNHTQPKLNNHGVTRLSNHKGGPYGHDDLSKRFLQFCTPHTHPQNTSLLLHPLVSLETQSYAVRNWK